MPLVLNSSSITGIGSGGLYAPGHVLQTVCNNFTSYLSGNNGTYADVSGFSVTITPQSTSSKVLIIYSINGITTGVSSATSYPVWFQLTDGSNNQLMQLVNNNVPGGNQAYGEDGYSGCYFHAPATTSAYTYKIRSKDDGSSHGWQINNYSNTSATYSSLVALEIAQ
jgi:hypothetical protein